MMDFKFYVLFLLLSQFCTIGTYHKQGRASGNLQDYRFSKIENLVILPVIADTPVTETMWDNLQGPYRTGADPAPADDIPANITVSAIEMRKKSGTRIQILYGNFLSEAIARHNIRFVTPSHISTAITDFYAMEIEQFSVWENPRDHINLFSKLHLIRYSEKGRIIFERIFTQTTQKADIRDISSVSPALLENLNRVVREHCAKLIDRIVSESLPAVS